jgi:predicted nucleic acid-binding Zn ribbon protein
VSRLRRRSLSRKDGTSIASTPEKIDVLLQGMLSEKGYLSVVRDYEVIHRWPEIVGESLAAHAQCSRVEDGLLYIRVESSSWRQEISYMKQHIMVLIKSKIKNSSIKDIVLY